MTILLTGATGTTGAHIARLLAGQGARVRALVRDPARAGWLADLGIEVVAGDLLRPETVTAALAGVERALLLPPNVPEQPRVEREFIDRAGAAGVRHVVKYSAIDAGIDRSARITRWHGEAEGHLRASGLDWTMVRPSYFMQNLLHAAPTIRAEGRLYLPMGDGEVGMVDCRDIAAVVAAALTGEGHAGRCYLVTGAESLGFAEAARRLGAALGRAVEYVPVSASQFAAALAGFGYEAWLVDAYNELFAEIAAGHFDMVSGCVARITGREPIGLAQFARDHAAAFA